MRTFDTPAPIAAVLDVPAGRVRVISADRTDTTVEVLPADASKGRDVTAAEQTSVAFGDGVLRIGTPAKNRFVGAPGAVEVTVRLPAGSRVEARTADAGFRGVGRLGDLDYEGAQGPVKVDEAASVRLTTAAGDVSVGRLDGPAEVTVQKGDIRIAEAARGEVVLRTLSGDISVGAATGVSASLDCATAHGRVHNALKNTDGTPGLTIRATTDHGDITARSL